MKHALAAMLLAGACLFGVTSAQATTRPTGPGINTTSVELIAEGCGRGYQRDRDGRCRPMYAPRPVCGYGYHPTPYGCRRN